MVKRTFLDATEALAHVEARAATERARRARTRQHRGRDHRHGVRDASARSRAPGRDREPETQMPSASARGTSTCRPSSPTSTRCSRASAPARPRRRPRPIPTRSCPGAPGEADAETVAVTEVDVVVLETAALDATDGPGATAAADPGRSRGGAGTRLGAVRWRARHVATVDPLLGPLVKRAKRGRPGRPERAARRGAAPQGPADGAAGAARRRCHVAEWTTVLRERGRRGVQRRRLAAGADAGDASDDAAARSGRGPRRSRCAMRIAVAIDAGEDGDTGGLVERIGARYREWKNQSLERALGEVLASAWSRGVYDAVARRRGAVVGAVRGGSLLRLRRQRARADGEGRSSSRPARPFPPAHPGCRCLLAPASFSQARRSRVSRADRHRSDARP